MQMLPALAPVTFRRAVPADIPLLRALADRIWRHGYAAILTAGQIDYMLGRMYGPDTVAAEMAAGVLWDIVEENGVALGYLAVTVGPDAVAELNKLYLLPDRQGQGIGQAALARAADLARRRGCAILRLWVHKKNARALAAYRRAGFTIVDAVVVDIGDGFVKDDYILENPLGPRPPPLVKICGLSTPDTMAAALDADADLVGLVFFPKSPRHVGLDRARSLAAQARGRAAIVALTVDADDAALAAILDAVAPDRVQLHGREPPERVAAVKARFGVSVLKALGVSTAADVAAAAAFSGVADTILFDAKPPPDAALPGGNGMSFDWTLLRDVDTPFMLSGGLTPATVGEALRITGAAAVDVSSGVERAPGVKDAAMIRAFVAAAKV